LLSIGWDRRACGHERKISGSVEIAGGLKAASDTNESPLPQRQFAHDRTTAKTANSNEPPLMIEGAIGHVGVFDADARQCLGQHPRRLLIRAVLIDIDDAGVKTAAKLFWSQPGQLLAPVLKPVRPGSSPPSASQGLDVVINTPSACPTSPILAKFSTLISNVFSKKKTELSLPNL
jgi:hypothetical protein